MHKEVKITVIVVIIAIVCYYGMNIFTAFKKSHTIVWGTTAQNYMYFFTDSVKHDIDIQSRYSYVGKQDIYNNYSYKKWYNVIIWEFKGLETINLSKLKLKQSVSLSKDKIKSGETINAHSSPEITIKFDFNFDNEIRVCYDEDSQIDTTFQSTNYRAFYGNIHEMLLKNVQWDPQIFFDYTNDSQYGLFIFYKKNKEFYILIINSDKEFDPMKLIQIFNLQDSERVHLKRVR